MADPIAGAALTPEEAELEAMQKRGLSQSGGQLVDQFKQAPPPVQAGGLPSGSNPLWNLAAKQEGINPYTGQPMHPLPPWHFQQGPMNLPPVPTPGQPLP